MGLMETHIDLMKALGGSTKVARALGFTVSTVSAWKHRNRIPFEHWPAMVKLAKKKGVKVDLQKMWSLDATPPKKTEAA